MPARSLGLVYAEQLQTYGSDLTFPRFNGLCQKFEPTGGYPDQLIMLLTDQSALFTLHRTIHVDCPYWQDTCELRSLLDFYFGHKLPNTTRTYWTIKPEPNRPGLDHWESTLSLVQSLFQQHLHELNSQGQQLVYLSHQAGTPALSSAIQFVCLTQFGSQVRFLVSNEYEEDSGELIDSSIYLRGLRIQEAKALLKRYDYAGVQALLMPLEQSELGRLLQAAIQWNFAEFEEFIQELAGTQSLAAEIAERNQGNWWWEAYESAWLAVVRLRQGNTVEAMFHSFRAVEGLLRVWVDRAHSETIQNTPHPSRDRCLNKYGQDLYFFLKSQKSIDPQSQQDIWIFGNHVFNRRNNLFHQLEGLQEKKKNKKETVFSQWQSPHEPKWRDADEEKWRSRICACLKFVSEQGNVESLEEACLMPKVHELIEEELEKLLWEVAPVERSPFKTRK